MSAAGWLAALEHTQRALDASAAPAMIIGGAAVIAHGVARTTLDIDATIDGAAVPLDTLMSDWAGRDIVARIDGATEFARSSQVLLLRDDPTGVDVDLSLAWLPFELEAIRRAETRTIGSTTIRVPRVDDLLVYKLVAHRRRDLDDAASLLARAAGSVDLERVRAQLTEFAAALEDDAPLRALAEILGET